MAPLTVALCVAVALQPMLAASVQKEDRVPKTSVNTGRTEERKRSVMRNEDRDRTQNHLDVIQRDSVDTAEALIQGHDPWLNPDVILADDVDEHHPAVQQLLEYLHSLMKVEEAMATVAGAQWDVGMRRKRDVISSEDEDKLLGALQKLKEHLPLMNTGRMEERKRSVMRNEDRDRTQNHLDVIQRDWDEDTAEDTIAGHHTRFIPDVIPDDDVDELHRTGQQWMEYLRSLNSRRTLRRSRGMMLNEDEDGSENHWDGMDDDLQTLIELLELLRKLRRGEATTAGLMHLWSPDLTSSEDWEEEIRASEEIAEETMSGFEAADVISVDDVDELHRDSQQWLEYLRSLDRDDNVEEKRGSLGQQQEASLAPPPTAEDMCQDLQRLGPGPGERVLLPFPLIQRHFLRLDENQNGFLDKAELSKFMETIEELKTCMTRAA